MVWLLGGKLAIQTVQRQVRNLAIALVFRQTPPSWPRPQGLQPNQPLDPVQTTVDAVCQQITPDPPCAVGPVARKEACLYLLAQNFVASRSGAGGSVQPRMEA